MAKRTLRKNIKRTLAITMSTAMVLSTTQMAAFAETTLATPSNATAVTQGDGTLENPEITTTTTTTVEPETGNTVVNTEYTLNANGTNEEGAEVSVSQEGSETVIKDGEGNIIHQSGENSGTETIVSEKTEDVPTITIDLTEGQKVTEKSDPVDPVISGDVPENENDTEYDYTVTEETEREVSAELGEFDTKTNVNDGVEDYESDKEIGLDPVNTEWSEDKEMVHAPNAVELSEEELKELLETRPDGYDYVYVARGEDSYYGVFWDFQEGQEGHISGEGLWDHYGTSPGQFLLVDMSDEQSVQDGLDLITAYCADLDTGSRKGYWYTVENLEDADYYKTEEAENHIRAIALNGYWGSTGTETDESGNAVPATGSLDAMKAILNEAKTKGAAELAGIDIDAMTEGEALAATQMAIWHYGNPYEEGIELWSSTMDEKWWLWNESHDQASGMTNEEIAAATARIDAVYNYLITLSMTEEEAGTTEIINEDKFIDGMSIAVGEKIEDHENNQDSDDTNDAYYVDLSFSLVVQPSEVNDDLIVKVVDANGEVIKTARLAGDDSVTNFGKIRPDENGDYTLTGLKLVEGQDIEFNLKLEGAQYLEQGVYVYTSEVRTATNQTTQKVTETTSQTFVGIAEGYKAVDVSMKVDLNFDVKEGTITQERHWSDEWEDDPDDGGSSTPDPEPDNGGGSTPDPGNGGDPDPGPTPGPGGNPEPEADETDGNLVVLSEMDVPLGNLVLQVLPATGDPSMLWLALSALSGLGLAGLTLNGRRKEDEE